MSVEAKAFDMPDDTVSFDHGHIELVKVGSITIGREVLVSATTRELTLGAGFVFIERGARALKGITGEWRLFEARLAPGRVGPDFGEELQAHRVYLTKCQIRRRGGRRSENWTQPQDVPEGHSGAGDDQTAWPFPSGSPPSDYARPAARSTGPETRA